MSVGTLIELNPQQEEAANTLDGPVKIVAGAGTGKTRVLTQRYLNIINSGRATPENILCVTFTNKAANEMYNRVLEAGISTPRFLSWIMTFHSFGARILRTHSDRIYPGKKFNIIDMGDAAKIVDTLISRRSMPTFMKGRRIAREILSAKDKGLTPAEYQLAETETSLDYDEFAQVAELYTLYQKHLEENGYFDFGDLLCKTIELFEGHPEILERYQDQLRYIQIDEYQDTNHTQHQLSMLLGEKHKNICVVGDPDQTIYTWRGARTENLLEFEAAIKTPVEIETVILEQNYRSIQNILDFANGLIWHNIYREEKNLWSEVGNESEDKVILKATFAQPSYISQKIDEIIVDGKYSYKDICVLYRNNNMSGAIETEFLKSSVPYETRDIAFYERLEIKDALAYLKVLDDPTNDIQMERIINTPRRALGKKAIQALKDWAFQNSTSLFEALQNVDSISELSAQAKKGSQKLLTALEEIWAEYGKDLEAPKTFAAALNALFEKIAYFDHLKQIDKKENDRSEDGGESNRFQNVVELIAICKDSEGLEVFLEAVSLDMESQSGRDDEAVARDKVALMTIHRAKGLEYPIVFVINMSQFAFPSVRHLDDIDDLEEERRLAYVAFTRAMHQLILTWDNDYQPSQFIQEACSRSSEAFEYID